MLKKFFIFFICVLTLGQCVLASSGEDDLELDLASESAILMEASTGTVLYAKDANAHRAPASVTKVMTMLLVMEAIEAGEIALDTLVTVSENAASMGGSQIWLEEGEKMTVDELLKCVAVVSANDCAVALAERISGSEAAFVRLMNERAKELGMYDSHFTNCTGLFDDPQYYTSVYDIALASQALLSFDEIREYCTIWMDTVRSGEFTLSSTNKLLKQYDGTIGLKTGFTNSAMYCLSAAAEREGTLYIAVVFHAPTSQERFDDAKELLDYAFSNYELVSLVPNQAIEPVAVKLGTADAVSLDYDEKAGLVLQRNSNRSLSYEVEVADECSAPVVKGQRLGVITVRDGDEIIAKLPLSAHNDVPRIKFFQLFKLCASKIFC